MVDFRAAVDGAAGFLPYMIDYPRSREVVWLLRELDLQSAAFLCELSQFVTLDLLSRIASPFDLSLARCTGTLFVFPPVAPMQAIQLVAVEIGPAVVEMIEPVAVELPGHVWPGF